MNKELTEKFKNKKIVILGFGREGQSTYRYLRQLFPEKPLAIADIDNSLPGMFPDLRKAEWITGNSYQKKIDKFDIIIKSPGIKLTAHFDGVVTSQADLFLKTYGDQIIGVTGTKGKSTTASLIYHIIRQQTNSTVLVGNIGIPPFDAIERVDENTLIVNEMSAHQLESTSSSPNTAVFLNLFEEHLDRFADKSAYYQNKLKVLKNQQSHQHAVLNDENQMNGDLDTQRTFPGKKWLFGFEEKPERHAWIFDNMVLFRNPNGVESYPVGKIKLEGRHNLLNVMAAITACRINRIDYKNVLHGLESFNGLEHRLEKVGVFRGVTFYNDSISTVPQATIEALKTIKDTDTLILGGFDRNINYQILYDFLKRSTVSNVIFTGPAGKRMLSEFSKLKPRQSLYFEESMENIVSKAFDITEKGKVCLLSPAASSYDKFKNFEERGASFKKAIKNRE